MQYEMHQSNQRKTMSEFQYKIEHTEGDTTSVVHLQGRLIEQDSATEMMQQVNNQLDNGVKLLAINLAKLEYINSSGLNCLVNLLTKSRSKGGDMALYNLSDKIKSLFIVTKLNTVFNVVETRDEALNSLNV